MKAKKTRKQLLTELEKTLPRLEDRHLMMLNGILSSNRDELKMYMKFMIDCMDWDIIANRSTKQVKDKIR